MRIAAIDIANFRKLKLVRVDLQTDTTVLVGANNSGKTSAMEAMRLFLTRQPLRPTDFTISDVQHIRDIGEAWEAAAQGSARADLGTSGIAPWVNVLPTLDIWLEAEETELYLAPQLLPILDEYRGGVGLRIRYEPKDLEGIRRRYVELRTEVLGTLDADELVEGELPAQLWPRDLPDYLDKELAGTFTLRLYKLDAALLSPSITFSEHGPSGIVEGEMTMQPIDDDEEPLAWEIFSNLIQVDSVDAQRGLDPASGIGRLSAQVSDYYVKHLDPGNRPQAGDLRAIRTTQDASRAFDIQLESAFKSSLEEISQMGYPGSANPDVIVRTNLQLTDGLRHASVLRYRLKTEDTIPLELPEGLNGLGYQNLVLMIFSLMSFRQSRRREKSGESSVVGPRPIHLVMIEEPEAHLHAQVQQVFIKKAYSTLTNGLQGEGLSTQLLISTHSSHVVHEVGFDQIRYFRRDPANAAPIPLTSVVNLTTLFGDADDTSRFVQRYIRLHHCNVFFADALVVVEGAAESILVPEFVRRGFPRIAESYVEFLEIGGAHAHRLEPLITLLGVPTLVITDIDAVNATDSSKTLPTSGTGARTGNSSLTSWLGTPVDLDQLLALTNDQKTISAEGIERVRFAFQTPVPVTIDGTTAEVVASTFEDALALQNVEVFRDLEGTGLVRKFAHAIRDHNQPNAVAAAMFQAIKSSSKAKFALDVLWLLSDPGALRAPNYIDEGLAWLEAKVDTLNLVSASPLDGATEPSPAATQDPS